MTHLHLFAPVTIMPLHLNSFLPALLTHVLKNNKLIFLQASYCYKKVRVPQDCFFSTISISATLPVRIFLEYGQLKSFMILKIHCYCLCNGGNISSILYCKYSPRNILDYIFFVSVLVIVILY